MHVYIAFDGRLEAVPYLERALKAWDKVRYAEPEVIEVEPSPLWEVRRRVIADGVAPDDYYILADVDAAPEEAMCLADVHKQIAHSPDMGLAFIRPLFDLGERVRVLRKGLVEKWPQQSTLTYDAEHGEAIIRAGKQVETWDIWYRHLPSLVVN